MKEFLTLLADVERGLLASVVNEDILKSLKDRLKSVQGLIANQLQNGDFDKEELRGLDEQVARIKDIAIFFRNLKRDGEQVLNEIEVSARNLAYDGIRNTQTRIKPLGILLTSANSPLTIPSADTLNSKLLRQWFLDHLADPFPSRRQKGELVEKTNALIEAASPGTANGPLFMKPIDTQQCSLWFVNSRRRSGWTNFHRAIAHSQKNVMVRLIEILKAEEGAEKPDRNIHLESILEMNPDGFKCSRYDLASRVKHCREAFAAMQDWLYQRKKEEVGDWMAEVIEEARVEVRQAKAAARLERKRNAESLGEEIEVRDQKRHIEDVASPSESDTGGPRYPFRDVRRRRVLKRGKGKPTKPSNVNSTPDHFVDQVRSSKDFTALGNSDGSRRVPSLVHSDGNTSRSSSSSSFASTSSSTSSLCVYPGTLGAPGSPTLRILRNSQPRNADRTMIQLPQESAPQSTSVATEPCKAADEGLGLLSSTIDTPDWLQVPTNEPELDRAPA